MTIECQQLLLYPIFPGSQGLSQIIYNFTARDPKAPFSGGSPDVSSVAKRNLCQVDSRVETAAAAAL